MRETARLPAQTTIACLLGVPCFFLLCLLSASTLKTAAILLALAFVAAAFLFWERLRERIALPLLALAAFALMDGISTQYAIAGKFALYEFLKVLCALCVACIFLALTPGDGKTAARRISCVLETASAVTGLVSIDLLSTHLLSDAVLAVLKHLTPDYANVGGVEAGVRMTSLFSNPNVFAGCAGFGVLLSLCLAASAASRRERALHCALLYVNALSFLLAFSMGATMAIGAAFLAYLVFERRERRPGTLLLMLATLALTLLSAIVISQTSFDKWSGTDAVPLLCALLGAAALALLDRFALQRISAAGLFHGRAVSLIVLALLGAAAAFAVAAWNLTGAAALEPGASLRRAAYPAAGEYTLRVSADKPLGVTVESQNQAETMMHTSTVLYQGDADGAAFSVPEGSMVVYFNFFAPEGAVVDAAAYEGSGGSGSIPLDYRLLPGFVSNRLQGLLANENAIQRFVFFSDGLKLFRRSPLIGLGMGSFENAIKSVQPFYYATKYAHNHYIQTLAEAGLIGLVLFLGVFAVSAAALWRARDAAADTLVPGLAAALVFMAIHGAVEVVFSSYPYLPYAYAVIVMTGLVSGGEKRLPAAVRTGGALAVCVFVFVFAVLTVGNILALRSVQAKGTFASLEEAARMDRFEWADYLLTYVDQSLGENADDEVRRKGELYADRLSRTESNSMPAILANYYFRSGNRGRAFEMLEKYVAYVASDANCWNDAYHMLAQYDDGDPAFGAEAVKLYGMMQAWNEANIGVVTPDEDALAYLSRSL